MGGNGQEGQQELSNLHLINIRDDVQHFPIGQSTLRKGRHCDPPQAGILDTPNLLPDLVSAVAVLDQGRSRPATVIDMTDHT